MSAAAVSSRSMTSRRTFLAAGAAGAASVWVPRSVNGYSASEVRAALPNRLPSPARLTSPARSAPHAIAANEAGQVVRAGVSKWDLDTPALCVDLDKLEANIAKAQAVLTKNGIAARPHAKTHKCAAIAKLQLAAGAIGICAAKLSEAEALRRRHRQDLHDDGESVGDKIRRAMQLRKTTRISSRRSTMRRTRATSRRRRRKPASSRTWSSTSRWARAAAIRRATKRSRSRKLVDTLPNLKLRGMLSYDGGAQHINGFAARKERALKGLEANVAHVRAMKAAGLNTEIFSGGGTGTYSVQHLAPGFTDVQVGSYIFMDMQYLAIGSEDGSRSTGISRRR